MTKNLINKIKLRREAKQLFNISELMFNLLRTAETAKSLFCRINDFRALDKSKYLEWYFEDNLDTDYVKGCLDSVNEILLRYGKMDCWILDDGTLKNRLKHVSYKDKINYMHYYEDVYKFLAMVQSCYSLITFFEDNPNLTIRKK